MRLDLNIPDRELARVCRRYGIARLALFGSVLHGEGRPDSDVDLLVEFEPERRVGLDFFAIERRLSQLMGRTVDLNTVGFLSPCFRDEVLREARDIYVAT